MSLLPSSRFLLLGLSLAAATVVSACETVGTVLEPDVPDALPGRDATTYVPEDASAADVAWPPDAAVRDAAAPEPDAASGADAATDAGLDAGPGEGSPDAGAVDGGG